ncbi:hypothetical protein DPMN_101037 [Dreissena polymorpha]|uniref:Uncharacterized protein n=1 Tax=Dreissena polymorpha TaxID=45954 RepID=A0A9D4LGZ0_DREPO|nr:hypothetical protein DPMN_101037 [Dreissena polymorpha]
MTEYSNTEIGIRCHPYFKETKTIFELIQDIIGTYLLTNFHDDRKINVTSRVLTRQNAPSPWLPYIIGTKHLTKFHDDRTINVASRVLTRKNAPPPDIIRTSLLTKFYGVRIINCSHVFQPTSIIFELVQDIITVNLLTKFHEDQTINVASRVKIAPPLGSHVFQANVTIFELIQDIIETNLLTKFHENWTINVASRVFKRKKASPLGSHVFQANTNLPTKFHEDWTINVASILLTRKIAPPPGGHVFSPIWTIFELVRDINENNVLTKNTAPPPGGHTNILTKLHEDQIFKLSRGINRTNVLTEFYEDQTINVASRVFTRQNVDNARRTTDKKRSQKLTMSTLKNAPSLGIHVFQAKISLEQNLLSKFHEDRKINVPSRVLTRKNAPPPWWPCIIRMNLLTEFHEDRTIIVASRVLTRFYYSHI